MSKDNEEVLWQRIRDEFSITSLTMKALADKHGVKSSTLRSRKNREGWTKKEETTQRNTQRNVKKNVATQRNTEKAVRQIEENPDLNEKQKLFCLYYSQSFNATQSYMKAYKVSRDTADANAYRLMGNDGIRAEIQRIKDARRTDWLIDDRDLIEPWMQQAFADIGDYVDFGTEEVTLFGEDDMPLFDEKGEPVTHKRSYIYFKDPGQIDTSLIQEVKMGRDGAVLKLYDRQTALTMLERLISSNEKKTLELRLLEAKVRKEELELELFEQDLADDEEVIDDGFLEALGKIGEDIWDE